LTSFTGADLARAVLGHRGSRGPLTELESRLGLAPVPDFPLTPFVSGYESI
jgi:hypothetical protein